MKASTWASINFGRLKSPLELYLFPGDCYGIDFLLRITYLGDKFKLTVTSAHSAIANLSLPLIFLFIF